jgi:hypothetical protein
MCLRRAPEKYIAGAALDKAGLDSRLTDGSMAVSPKHRLRCTHQKHYFSAPGTHFCYRLSKPQGPVRTEGLGKLKTLIHLIGSRTSGLPACSMMP